MVADLLESHQERQHDTLALDAFGFIELLGQFLHRLLVERCLLAAELAEGLDLGFVGQVRNDRLVGLQPAQNVRPHELAKGPYGLWGLLRQAFDEARELLRRSEQARIDESRR